MLYVFYLFLCKLHIYGILQNHSIFLILIISFYTKKTCQWSQCFEGLVVFFHEGQNILEIS